MADFRQFYGIDLPLAPEDGDLPRRALLWAALPCESRTARRKNPALEWSTAEYLLRNVEYYVHLLWWSRTKDAKRGRNVPEPVPTPGQEAAARTRAGHALANKESITRRLGYDPASM